MKEYIEKTLEYYENNAHIYKDFWVNEFSKNYDFNIPDIFLSYLNNKSKILDLGCGVGRDSKYFIEKGYNVISIDGSKKMCEIAHQLTGLNVEQVNFLNINYENEFDGVFACASLLHLTNDDLLLVLNKIAKALKDKGVIYASFKLGNKERFDNGKFYNDMTEEKFLNLCNCIKELKIIKTWLTSQYKSEAKFINYIIQKNK